MAKITIEEFQKLMTEELPWAVENGLRLEAIEHGKATMVLPYSDNMLRPGGTVSGPSMMALADGTMFAVVLSMIGHVKMAVTTNFNINFLRKPMPADLIAEGSIIKLGKRLAVIEVTLFSEVSGETKSREPIAHATGTYSIPPR